MIFLATSMQRMRLFLRFRILFALTLLIGLPAGRLHADQIDQLPRLQTISTAALPVDAAAFSPDGRRIATGGRDNIIHLWDTTDGAHVFRSAAHTDWITSLAFSPDGRWIVSGSRDDSVRLTDASTGQLVQVMGGHADDVSSVGFSPDGRWLASGGRDGYIQVYDMDSRSLTLRIENFGGDIWHLAFSPEGTSLAVASEGGDIWLYGLQLDSQTSWLKQLTGHQVPVTRLAYSADGRQLLTGALDGTVRLWNIGDSPLQDIQMTQYRLIGQHRAPVMGLGFTQNDQLAVSVGLDGELHVWNTDASTNSSALATLRTDGLPFTHLALSTDASQAAVVGTDGQLIVWQTDQEAVASLLPAPGASQVVAAPQAAAPQAAAPQAAAPQAVQPQSVAPQATRPALPEGRSLYVPGANIVSPITHFPLDGIGRTWVIDPWEHLVGHFEGTAWMNATGNIVLGGHSEYPNGTPGIFANLYNVGIGDEIFLRDGATEQRYVVVNVRSVDYRDISVVYPTGHNRLTLITCDIPSYVATQGIYYERLVIIADEIG